MTDEGSNIRKSLQGYSVKFSRPKYDIPTPGSEETLDDSSCDEDDSSSVASSSESGEWLDSNSEENDEYELTTAQQEMQEMQNKNRETLEEICDNRLSCIAHVLTTVVKKVTDKPESPFQKLKRAIVRFVNRFNKSGVAVEQLKREIMLSLFKMPNTRWMYFYYVSRRLNKVWLPFYSI